MKRLTPWPLQDGLFEPNWLNEKIAGRHHRLLQAWVSLCRYGSSEIADPSYRPRPLPLEPWPLIHRVRYPWAECPWSTYDQKQTRADIVRYLNDWRREPDGPRKPHLWRYRPKSKRGKERGSLALVMPWVNPRYVRPLLEPVTGPLLWLHPVAGNSSHANVRTFVRPWPKAEELLIFYGYA